MDEDDLTVDGRFRSRDIINADTASLETDPEAVLVPSAQKNDCAPRSNVLQELLTNHPLYLRPWCWKRFTHF